jgi:hypothetical protein
MVLFLGNVFENALVQHIRLLGQLRQSHIVASLLYLTGVLLFLGSATGLLSRARMVRSTLHDLATQC